ncbi:tumor necrosis factor receptor superfamily member 14 isoform X2 [Pleurodeles waltl]|uniref:tumor necrosis factor receptor superfamily member 14 isoform X2 n=1 Tax=Pleurodeles waltl TaxID=8319 RepID=UPI0037096D71
MRLLYIASLVVIFLKGVAQSQDPLCESGEYFIDGDCCPMCDSGNRVQRPCTTTTSGATSCIPCIAGTYMDHPSGLTECFKCKSCDSGSGLLVKSSCTYTRNTVCSCMGGYYCLNPATEECDLCERHTVCVAGEKVKVPGTERTNTVCERCPIGTFSNRSMANSCVEWMRFKICVGRTTMSLKGCWRTILFPRSNLDRNCRDLGRTEKEPGTHLKDAECGQPIRIRPVIVAPFVVAFVIAVVFITIIWERRKEGNKKDDKTTTANEPPFQQKPLPVQETQDPATTCNTPALMLPQSTASYSGDQVEIQ